MKKTKKKPWILYLSTFPPRECGIATFTQDLTTAMDKLIGTGVENKIIAMNLSEFVKFKYPREVVMQIDEPNREVYKCVAEHINTMEQVKVVNIQHEFGIYGGESGEYLLDFVNELKIPVVVTLHTILPDPDEKKRHIMIDLANKAAKLVVMTKMSKHLLQDNYSIDGRKIEVIPHGIHPVEFKPSSAIKSQMKLNKKTVITTFGLLSRNKGIEYVLEALPEVIKNHPNIVYWVIGATHPVVLKEEGEAYRNMLEKKVKQLKLTNYVRFYNQYLELPELLRFLKATDIYVSTGLSPEQAVSGTLSYALGTGRAVISTRFAQAREAVTDEVGLTVGFKNPQEYTEAINQLIDNEARRNEMARNAYMDTRMMVWPNVALANWRIFCDIAPELKEIPKTLPDLKLAHMAKMTDKFGMIQYAKMTVPDKSSGYTADDNARALIAVGQYLEKKRDKKLERLAMTYLNFVEFVGSQGKGFLNYVGEDFRFRDDLNNSINLEDAQARTFLSLGTILSLKRLNKDLRKKATTLWRKKWNEGVSFSYPRATAFWIKALYFALKGGAGDGELTKNMIDHCEKLIKAYNTNSEEGWKWFEPFLTYSNSILSEALAWGYMITKNRKYLDVATESLEFLIRMTFDKGVFVPVGQNGWYFRKGKRQYFDQQPEDTSVMVRTLGVMYKITKQAKYKKLMEKAFNWYLGENMLGRMIYDEVTGGSYDGMGENYINLNEGAESTVSYILARMAVEEVRKAS